MKTNLAHQAGPTRPARRTRTDATTAQPQLRLAEAPTPDFEAIKTRQQATWAAGDFGQVGVRLQIVGESISEAVDLLSTERVLDVAAGNGNASLAAARRFADVTSTDYVPALLEEGRRRAEAEQLPMKFEVADAENLPFEDGSFDVVLSTFGVMFAPNQERAAAEMLRVVRPGGRIGLANWTHDGFIGRLFEAITRFVPPPAGLRSPMAWGSKARLQELFASATKIETERKSYVFRYRSAEHWIEFFRTYYGPTNKAFAALDEAGRQALHAALLELIGRWETTKGGPVVIPATYLEVVVTK
ncbi:MAG TPA: methyltransferase domain-containing protein [Candidatus Eisenbacteria bacterium]|nr:methyltransferase domain-containing protein [Candidatus Eisenbacteria bacterium]